MRVFASFVLASLIAACGGEDALLVVDLRTDLVPIEEFIGAEIVVATPDGAVLAERAHVPDRALDYVAGVRLAEIPVDEPMVVLSGTLIGLSGEPALSRRVLVQLAEAGRTGVTLLMTRDCVGVVCSDPAAPACLGEICVPEECSPERPEPCPTPECSGDDDCVGEVECARGACRTGTCVFPGDDTACDEGQWCNPDVGCQPVSPGDWWDTDWPRRRRLSFQNASRAENLADFPVLVPVSDADASSVRFVDADGATMLAHEIVGANEVWVRVPQIDASTDDDLVWMYYGNAAATPLSTPQDVWLDPYEAVWHLEPELSDSSPSGWDLTDESTSDVEGQHGRGRGLNSAANSYLFTAPDTSSFAPTAVTLSAWTFRTVAGRSWQGVVTRPSGMRPSANEYYLGYRLDAPFGEYASGPAEDIVTGDPVGIMNWHHIATTYDGRTMTVYLDGQPVRSGTFSGPLEGSGRLMILGADTNSGGDTPTTDFYDGIIDEVRVEGVQRSAMWIDAQYAASTDALVVVGPEQR